MTPIYENKRTKKSVLVFQFHSNVFCGPGPHSLYSSENINVREAVGLHMGQFIVHILFKVLQSKAESEIRNLIIQIILLYTFHEYQLTSSI
jgi:hypothetical protein